MIVDSPAVAEPEEILRDLLGLDRGLVRQAYFGERSVFYNPDGAEPLGTIVASIRDRDGPNDKAADLSRAGVFRFAFQLSPEEYARRFGAVPSRPPKGGAVDVSLTSRGSASSHRTRCTRGCAGCRSSRPTREQYQSLKRSF